MDLFDAKMNERSVVFKSLEKLNGREFKEHENVSLKRLKMLWMN